MIIRQFSCENLGGIVRQDLELLPGLNVIYGPNEAGKSTVVDGILATLFRNHRKKNTAADREFEEKFRPYPYGDSMKCQLVFIANGQEFQLQKAWGGNPQLSIALQGQVLKEEKTVLAKLSELLLYGEGTYANVVFARQKDLRIALEKLHADEDTGHILGDILHKAVMVLDGISIERLKKRIDEEYTTLQGHWDTEHKRPEKGRGFEDPWRTGKGIVLDSYYKKEELRSKINLTRQMEDEYSTAVEKLREISQHREVVRTSKNKYAILEEDISRRLLLETEVGVLEKEIQELKEIIQQKPAKEAELEHTKREIERVQNEDKELRAELGVAHRIINAKAARELLERNRKIKEELAKKIRVSEEYPIIEDSLLKRLEELHNQLTTAKATLQAATLQASLKKSSLPVYITRGLKEREIIVSGSDFSASGFFRLETEDGLELEVRAGQINFDALSAEFTKNKAEYAGILQKLQVPDLVEAKKINALKNVLGREIQLLETQLAELEKGRDMAVIRQEVQETVNLTARQEEELIRLLNNSELALREAKLQAALLQNTLESWVKKYGQLEQLLDNFAQRSGLLEEKRRSLAALAPLPVEFSSPADFKEELARLRKQDDTLAEEERLAQKACFERERQLPEVTLEELQGLSQQAEALFQRQLHRLHKVTYIREVFQQKSSEMNQDSYRPLAQSFSKYLAKLTLTKYSLGEVSEALEVKIIRQDNVPIPSTLLSTGTADTVLLALRLALLETLFPANEGVVVLDDCLVNLDPARKEKAAQVLREFSSLYQVIFTTCDPQTAEILGGNIIRL